MEREIQMTQEELKQRLIELLMNKPYGYSTYEEFADYLLANGVTIRERGEWVRQDGHRKCSKCGKSAPYWQTGTVFATTYVQAKTDFCPHCGADMRGVKDE